MAAANLLLMKKTIAVVALAALVAGAFAVTPAEAGKKPQKVTMYFHGGLPIGEPEIVDGISGLYRTMDTTKPTDPVPKSVALTAAGAGGNGTPNPTCAGNPLFPVWVGDVTGKVVGDVKVALDAASLPVTKIDVRLWGIVPGIGACDSGATEAYVDPAAEVRVDVPPGAGTIEAVFKKVNFPAEGKLMIQFTPVLDGVTYTRVLYDSTTTTSQIQFTCIPTSGKSCV